MVHVISGIFVGVLAIVCFICFGLTIKDKAKSLWYFAFGVSALLLTIKIFVAKETNHMHQLISECEQTLPRNQHCELIAIPKEMNINR